MWGICRNAINPVFLFITIIIFSLPLLTVLLFSLLPLRAALTQGSSGLLYKKNNDKEKGKAKFDWVCRTFNCVYTTGIKVVLLVGLIFVLS